MKTMDMKKATLPLSTYARELREGPVVVTDRGKPLMVLLPVEGADLETVSLSLNPRFLAIIERPRASCRPGEGITTHEMRRRLALRRRERKAG